MTSVAVAVKSGIPFETALHMTSGERTMWILALGEADGGEFNFRTWKWMEKD